MYQVFESISAVWQDLHKLSFEEYSKKITVFLELLKEQNATLFSKWYEKGYSAKNAVTNEVCINEGYFLKKLLQIKRKYEDVGVTISYWTGTPDVNLSSSISFTVGGYGAKSFNNNSCVLNLPTDNSFYRVSQNQDNLVNLMRNHWGSAEILINGKPL
jgi:hypothetical protein